jgi:hypothetical protein
MTEEPDTIWSKRIEKVLVYDKWCWYKKLLFSESWDKHDPDRICPICNQPLTIGKPAYMVINNYRMFPNTLIHKSCVKVSLTATTLDLIKSFDQFKDFMNKNKAWAKVTNHAI